MVRRADIPQIRIAWVQQFRRTGLFRRTDRLYTAPRPVVRHHLMDHSAGRPRGRRSGSLDLTNFEREAFRMEFNLEF